MPDLRIVFDLDDTLYPEREFALSGFRAAGRWAEQALGIAGMAEEMERLFDEGHLGPLFRKSLARFRPDHLDQDLANLVEAYRTHEPDISLYADGAWALAHYGAHSPLGLITDGTESMQAGKVRALDIAPHFEKMVLTDALGGKQFRKPHPLSYVQMEEAMGGGDVRFVYVGDNPSKDFVVPNARGWISIQVRRPGGIHDADKTAPGGAPQHVIHSLHDLPKVLGQ